MAHEMAEATLNPSALEDGRGCWSGAGFEVIDVCDNQRGYVNFAGNRKYALPSMVL